MTDHDHDARTAELRRRLAEQAEHAPAGDLVAARVLARTGATATGSRHRRRRGADLPWLRLMAVAAAIIVVAGVALGIARSGQDGPDQRVAEPPATASPLTPAPTSSAATTPTDSSSAPVPLSSDARRIVVPTLTDVRVSAVTFTGGGNGWALGSADCLRGAGRCTALLHTDDGGLTWKGRPNTPFAVPGVRSCAAPCVTDLRFATDTVGYAFGRSALFLTTDGAKTWQRLTGGADALETLDGTVIRVSSDATSCPPGCDYRVQVSDIGSTSWQSVDLPGSSGPGDGVTLSRTGSAAYLLQSANPAGGAGSATSTLWSSTDDGRSWRNRGEPCSQSSGESDSVALTTAADGSVAVVCRPRSGGAQSVAVSTDGGRDFTDTASALGSGEVIAFGAADARTLLVSLDTTYRSSDGGATFRRAAGVGQLSYLGFSSATVVHAVAADSRTIYTSDDAGLTWRAARFS